MKVEYLEFENYKIYKINKVKSVSFGYGFVIIELESNNSILLYNNKFHISRIVKDGCV